MTAKLKVFLVEDEAYVRDEIRFMLEKYDGLEIVGEEDNSFDAILKIQSLRPGVVFCDIKLGDVSGITLAQKIVELDPEIMIVFVTAYEHYAIKGFELNAVDYVLKPFSEERLAKTVERILQPKRSSAPDISSLINEKMIVKKKDIWKLINVADIYYFQADGHRITAVTSKETYRLNYTLRELDSMLPSGRFLRVHKGVILNADYIDEIIPWFNYTYKVKLKNGIGEIFVSRNYIKQFKSTLMIS